MNLTLPIPDELAQRLGADAAAMTRRALEAFGAAEHRAGRLTRRDLRRLLRFATEAELDGFLRANGLGEGMAPNGGGHSDVATSDVVARFRAFRTDKTLDGLDPVELIREGRR